MQTSNRERFVPKTSSSQKEAENAAIRQRNKMRLSSIVPKSEIQRQDTPTDECKFCCPVCLQYLNHILVSSCCSNYICRFCIGQMSVRARSDSQYTIRCAYCTAGEFKLRDVDSGQPVKDYLDRVEF